MLLTTHKSSVSTWPARADSRRCAYVAGHPPRFARCVGPRFEDTFHVLRLPRRASSRLRTKAVRETGARTFTTRIWTDTSGPAGPAPHTNMAIEAQNRSPRRPIGHCVLRSSPRYKETKRKNFGLWSFLTETSADESRADPGTAESERTASVAEGTLGRGTRRAATTTDDYGGPAARRRRADDGGELEQTRRARRGREPDALRRSAGGCTKRLGAAGTRGTKWKTASARILR